jgi:hypothetical protein
MRSLCLSEATILSASGIEPWARMTIGKGQGWPDIQHLPHRRFVRAKELEVEAEW